MLALDGQQNCSQRNCCWLQRDSETTGESRGERRVAASISMKEWECVGVFPGKCGRDALHTGGRKVTCGFRRAALSDERGATMKIAFVQP